MAWKELETPKEVISRICHKPAKPSATEAIANNRLYFHQGVEKSNRESAVPSASGYAFHMSHCDLLKVEKCGGIDG